MKVTKQFEKYLYSTFQSGIWFYVDIELQTPKAKYSQTKHLARYKFKTEEDAEKWVNGQIEAKEKRAKEVAEAKALLKRERALVKAADYYNVGDILVLSWGYDQTNVDFYQVVSVGSNKQITVQSIGQNVSQQVGHMAEYVVPVADSFMGSEATLTVREKGYLTQLHGKYNVKKWDGKPCYQSHYA